MTDREKLIEILKVPIYPHLDADPAEVAADYLLDNGVTFATDTNVGSKWISVEDGLPEEGAVVICLTKGGGRLLARYNHRVNRWQCASQVKITHWMPPPEPPREG